MCPLRGVVRRVAAEILPEVDGAISVVVETVLAVGIDATVRGAAVTGFVPVVTALAGIEDSVPAEDLRELWEQRVPDEGVAFRVVRVDAVRSVERPRVRVRVEERVEIHEGHVFLEREVAERHREVVRAARRSPRRKGRGFRLQGSKTGGGATRIGSLKLLSFSTASTIPAMFVTVTSGS